MSPQKLAHYICYKIAPWPWAGRAKAVEFLEIFRRAGLALEKFGLSEVRTFRLQGRLDDLISTWNEKGYAVLKTGRPWKVLVVPMMFPAGISDISTYIPDGYFEDTARASAFVDLVRNLYSWGGFDYCYVAHEDEYESKNVLHVGPAEMAGGSRPDRGLPGIYWINIFGARYVQWLGDRKFDSLSAYSQERLADGGRMVLARPKLLPCDDSASRESENRIRKHLGEQLFFDRDHPDRVLTMPPFAKIRPQPL